MHRRRFLRAGSAAAIGAAVGGCVPRSFWPASARRAAWLVPPDIGWHRVIRTTVGLRPYRPSGFVVRKDRLDRRTLVHNYGHGGAGMSLSWGTAHLAADLLADEPDRRAAVIGCGVAGLTTARVLQRRGFHVTIYARELPPNTTSNMSWAGFTPTSGLVARDRRTPEWDAQFRRAAELAYRELQLLAGRHYGVSWIDEYVPTDDPGPTVAQANRGRSGALLPAELTLDPLVFGPGEHPFRSRYVRVRPMLRFEPSTYLDMLMRDVIAFGGRIITRGFDTTGDLLALDEPILVNCTGLGAARLFSDTELTPVRGQLVVLVPQPEVDYLVAGMMPRRDGIVLGHTMRRGDWSLEVDPEEQARVIDNHLRIFQGMRALPAPAAANATVAPSAPAPRSPPPVDAFFDRVS